MLSTEALFIAHLWTGEVVMEFLHPSRPGYFDVHFGEELKASLMKCVDVLIPGDGFYPSASQASVVDFLETRSSDQDHEKLQWISGFLEPKGCTEGSMHELENNHAEVFTWFRDFVYHGYYASLLVMDALNRRGYDYHGAPQPLGYQVGDEPPRPGKQRGSFLTTREVLKSNV